MGYALRNVIANERAYIGSTQVAYEFLAQSFNEDYTGGGLVG